jgi:hypothetical protein
MGTGGKDEETEGETPGVKINGIVHSVEVKHQIPACGRQAKHQITNKFQSTKFKIPNKIVLVIENWSLGII